jgi:PHD/YefM family antitoxin component YafN of YafNO toxin-antitoxin module
MKMALIIKSKANIKKISEQYVIDKKGKKKAVIIPINEYKELLEDLHDLAIVSERRDESCISFEELKKQLKDDGLL